MDENGIPYDRNVPTTVQQLARIRQELIQFAASRDAKCLYTRAHYPYFVLMYDDFYAENPDAKEAPDYVHQFMLDLICEKMKEIESNGAYDYKENAMVNVMEKWGKIGEERGI